MKFGLVVAATAASMGIGRQGQLPWRLRGDMSYFKKLTSTAQTGKRNAVIMGRKTYESIAPKFRPLSERLNIILSRNPSIREDLGLPESVLVCASLEEALAQLSAEALEPSIDKVFVIGGGTVYREAILLPSCDKIYMTMIEHDFPDMDTFFPVVPAHKFRMTRRSAICIEDSINHRFTEFDRIDDDAEINDDLSLTAPSPAASASLASTVVCNSEEMQYLNAVRDILDTGTLKGDRTGTGTVSKFGLQMRFSLRENRFPLLTTKKVFWRGVAEELLWFIKGSTNASDLSDRGIKIWDGNGSREFLDSCGLSHREVGDLGPVYGFQWRHFGAEYVNMHTDYTAQGIDQLLDCISKIKNSPNDRRIIMSAWNPADLTKMALPPCHMFCQFYVANGELSCQMYQRSADMGLGVPFNIASYALLTVLVAQVCDLRPGDFIHSIGDAHVYSNHVEALREQLTRAPREFPRLFVNPLVRDIDGFSFSDLNVEGYCPDSTIKMKMAV